MVDIQIECPSCGKKGNITISENVFDKILNGLLAIDVVSDLICSHTFIIYIDKNFDVRDYFNVDFKIDIPESMGKKGEFEKQDLLDKVQFDIVLIKLNIPAILMAYILKSGFYKKKIMIISKHKYLYEHIIKFFKYISQESFNFDIFLVSEEEYQKNRKQLKKNYMIFKDNEILNNQGKIIEKKGLKIEKRLVNRFFNEDESGSGFIIFKNDIKMVYNLCKEIITIIENNKNNEGLGKAMIIEILTERTEKKISSIFLEFLLEIVKNYFNFNLSRILDYYYPAFGI